MSATTTAKCCSSHSAETTTPLSCCSHDDGKDKSPSLHHHHHDHHRHHHNNNKDNGEGETKEKSCWAVVDGVNVWLWDVAGVSRRFILRHDNFGAPAAAARELCFSSHHHNHLNDSSSAVDDLLTPCLDEQGRHGTPAEDCFCGEEDPHLHAHWYHPRGCGGSLANANKKRSHHDNDVERLAHLILVLHPEHDIVEEKQEEEDKHYEFHDKHHHHHHHEAEDHHDCHGNSHHPDHHPDHHHHHDKHHKQDAASVMAKQHGWSCCDEAHHELIRQDKETLLWKQDPCLDCTTEQQKQQHPKITALEPPSFSFAGRRAWTTTQQEAVHLDFFFLGQQLAACGCQKLDCCSKDPHGRVICKDENSPCAFKTTTTSNVPKSLSLSDNDKNKNKAATSSSQDTRLDKKDASSSSSCCGNTADCGAKKSQQFDDCGADKSCDKSKSLGAEVKQSDACCVNNKSCGKDAHDKIKEDCCGSSGGARVEVHKKFDCCSHEQEPKEDCCDRKDGSTKSDCCGQKDTPKENHGTDNACIDDCCGSDEETKTLVEQDKEKFDCCARKDNTKSSACGDGCCSSVKEKILSTPEQKSDCCASKKKTTPSKCEVGCCSDKGEKPVKNADCCSDQNKGCCGAAVEAKPGCCSSSSKDKCCGSSNQEHIHDEPTKTCCAGKKCGDGDAIEESTLISPVVGTGRSQFHVSGVCCASEIPTIHRILDGFEGIEKITVNTTTAIAYVDHQLDLVSAEEIASALTRKGMKAEIQIDAAHAAARSKLQSLFVVSKFMIGESSENAVAVDKDRVDVLMKAYDSTQVESFSFDLRTACLTVVHNPWTIKTDEIQKAIETGTKAMVQVLLDGSDRTQTPLDYAALAQSETASAEHNDAAANISKCPRPTVVLSGILWVISMLSYIGGNFEYLKYVALGSVAFGLPPIAKKAIFTLTQRFCFDSNGLMLMASIGAVSLGEFPEAGAVVFLFALSEWLEQRASARARQALSAIVQLRPDKARIIHPETQELWTVPATAVPVGALVSVKTGDKIPCDGIIVEGQSTVDESCLTGESRPLTKGPKATVSGGTVNTGMQQLSVRVTSTADDSAVARLIRLVEEAQVNRSETEKKIDRFAAFYTPLVLFAALLMCTIPWAYGLETGRKWTHNGLVLIVVACPCALVISTPVSYVAGLAASAQKGVLIKGGAFLEALGQVKHICVDKTGTLTTGEFCLLHLDCVGESLMRKEVLEHLLLMEERASHPVAQAIMTAARNENVSIPQDMVLESHTVLAGEGVSGVINGRDVFVGNERLFERQGYLSDLTKEVRERVDSWKKLGGTIGFIGMTGFGIVGAYCAADAVRPEAASVVQTFKKRGIALSMLTGDNEEAAESVGTQLGWHGEKNTIHAKLLPADKLTYVEELTAQSDARFSCFQKSIVLFCGDGVNDAPALAAAHVGVAMGSGAAVAMETAHVTLLDASLHKLEFAQEMGRRVLGKIYENVVFSIVVKAAVLAWAIAGTPSLWAAIASDVGSMLIVTVNAMRLLPSRASIKEPLTIMQKSTMSASNGDLEEHTHA